MKKKNILFDCVCFRWAQFFICPLMIEDAIDREVEAVDSGESTTGTFTHSHFKQKHQTFDALNVEI